MTGNNKKYFQPHFFALLCGLILLLQAANSFADDNSASALVTQLLTPAKTPVTTVVGNPAGDVTLIEFSDYNCHYCKMMQPIIAQLLQNDTHLRIVFVEYPVIAPTSSIAAMAALASQQQHKYLALHDALLKNLGYLQTATIMRIAKEQGIDVDKLAAEMNDARTRQQLATHLAISEQINIPGTPSFIIGKTILTDATATTDTNPYINFGYLGYDELNGVIKNLRK